MGTDSLNIALISREYPPFAGGGIGTYTRQFAIALAGAGHRPLVITVSADGMEHREKAGGVTVVRLPFLEGDDWTGPHPAISTPESRAVFRTFAPESVFAMQVGDALPRLIDDLSIDVIEAPDTGALAWFALNRRHTGRAWRERSSPPLVTVIHSPTAWIDEANRAPVPPHAALTRMEHDCARWSDALVSPTQAIARWAGSHWGTQSIKVIAHPLGDLEPQALRSAERADPMSAADLLRVLYVGRLEPRKGVDTLLAAWSEAGIAGATLDLAGQDMPDPVTGSPFGTSRLALVPEARRRSVMIHGRIAPDSIRSLRANAPIAIVPSPTDNFPYACLEAMAAGQLVIAARAGGMAELIRDGIDGLLFTPGDAASCAGALQHACALSPGDRQALGARGARRVLEVCGNDRVIDARTRHYAAVLASSRRGPGPMVAATDLACINGFYAPESLLARLAGAASQPEIDFTHGWTAVSGSGSVGRRVIAFETPSTAALAVQPRPLGPLMVRHEALKGAIPVRLTATNGPRPWLHYYAPNTWLIAATLCQRGFRGAVVPECVIDLPIRTDRSAENARTSAGE